MKKLKNKIIQLQAGIQNGNTLIIVSKLEPGETVVEAIRMPKLDNLRHITVQANHVTMNAVHSEHLVQLDRVLEFMSRASDDALIPALELMYGTRLFVEILKHMDKDRQDSFELLFRLKQ